MIQDANETAIRALLEARARAIRSKDADATLATCAPDFVQYDLAPPLATSGPAALDRIVLIAWFDTWRGPIRYELRDFSITMAGDIAFAHGFVLIGGTDLKGEATAVWTRQTVCLRKSGGAWTIVHEHTSTPFYMDGSLRAAVDLAPPGIAHGPPKPATVAVKGGVVAYLQVDGAMRAAEFHQRAFGADVVAAHPVDEAGRTMHVHLRINGGAVMLSDAYPEHGHGLEKPQAFNLLLQVDDIDAWWDRAIAAGAEPVMPVAEMFWGDRYGQLRDPFGVLWAMNQPRR